MRADALVAEIGSTVTKVHAFSGLGAVPGPGPRGVAGAGPAWLGSGVAPTTVLEGDVTAGLRQAVEGLEMSLGLSAGGLAWDRMMAASSAAGGLRMSVHGLVYDMTVRAAREAALGAGAILDLVTAGEMGPGEVEALRKTRPGIILLAGGVEGGDRAVILHNARTIAAAGVKAPVVYAGNSGARGEAVAILEAAGLAVKVVPNVYPRLDHLDIEPARRAIQDAFEEHIVVAPGMERVREMVGGTIWPTPGAVMESAVVLAERLGDLVVIDVGGATTDVHSVTDGSDEISRIQLHPEPRAKRTVEGDLGVYVNAANVVDLAGEEEVASYMRDLSRAASDAATVRRLLEELKPLPTEAMEDDALTFVRALTCIAAETALLRHAGRLRHLFGPSGRVAVAEGKDLTEVEWLIGTGGPLTRHPRSLDILSRLAGLAPGAAEARSRRADGRLRVSALGSGGPAGQYLLPGRGAQPRLDTRYAMAVLGVLHHEYPEAAEILLVQGFGGAWPRPSGSPLPDLS